MDADDGYRAWEQQDAELGERADQLRELAQRSNANAELLAVESDGEVPAVVVAGVLVRVFLEVDDSQDDRVEPELVLAIDPGEINPELLAILDGRLTVTVVHDSPRLAARGAELPPGAHLNLVLRHRNFQQPAAPAL